ncbi:MAG TPA: choice-of-anchor tandem repeat GloVer-containing protein, partial [Nevskiaceae bacterium]|nr:choice-of-anchor tandem repeat GloVer-containing protein [Nevskiaceae bacterium]
MIKAHAWMLAALLAPGAAGANGAYTQLHDFSGADGKYGQAELLLGSDGAFYGTTTAGGRNDDGVLFRVTTDGAYSVLHHFGPGASRPQGGVIQGSDGAFYGTTYYGGTGDNGSIYRVAPDRSYQRLHAFNGSGGAHPLGALAMDTGGTLYGTTFAGGRHDHGVVFSRSADGTYRRLHDFDDADGANPTSGVVIGPDGALYGVTNYGGAAGLGAAYRITTDGQYSKLHDFDNAEDNGSRPSPALTLGPDGALYGTTTAGGLHQAGIVFRLATGGAFTKLHDFDLDDYNGYFPYGVLTVTPEGTLYGTTFGGGDIADGAVFRLEPDGTYTKLHDFYGDRGHWPYAGVTLDADGVLYGVASEGGAQGYGTVFRLDARHMPTATITATPASIGPGETSTINWTSDGATSCFATSGNWFYGEQPAAGSVRRGVSGNINNPGGRFPYALTCSGPGGSVKTSATVTVMQPPPTLEMSVSASHAAVGT